MKNSDPQKGTYYDSHTPISQRGWVRYSFFFLAGIVAGILIGKFLSSNQADRAVSDQDVRGTIYNSSSFDKMKPADVIYFDNPGLKSVIDVKYSSQVVEARVEISSLNPVKVAIEFPPNDLRVLNVQNLSITDQSSILSSASFIQIVNVGDNNYIIQWYNKNNLQHEISFKFYQNEMVVYSNVITINKE
jgi:hypothetical protein